MVTYNSEDVIAGCLEALAAFAPELLVIVVDNASTDNTVAVARGFPVEVIANPRNQGFAGAANQGFRAAGDASLVLLMNPDVRLQSSVAPLAEASMQYGIAGGQLTGEDGGTQAGFTIRRFPTVIVLALELLGINRLWPTNPWNRLYRYQDRNLRKPGYADQPAGAFLMIRSDIWSKLGGFDETFWPIWFEDVDFCHRAALAGFMPYYVPEVTALHAGGHSIDKLDNGPRQIYWHDSLLKYARKHFGRADARFLCLAAVAGAVPRAVVGVVEERSLRPVSNCLRNLKFLGKRLVCP